MRKENKKIKINSNLYSKDIVFKVIDILANEYVVEVQSDGKYLLLGISPKYNKQIPFEEIKKIFLDHLNNQIIRDRVYKDTHVLRELIVGKALFETEAFDNDSDFFNINEYSDDQNYMLDLKNIAKPFNVSNHAKKRKN